MYGETQDGSWYFDLINSKQNIDAMRDDLIFGQAFVDAELLTA
jgi:nitrite reductase (NADH) large subunit